MKLRFLGKETTSDQSPTLYESDRDTYVVQGWKVTDAEALSQLSLPVHETVVEVPKALMKHLREATVHDGGSADHA
jgi:hypothetical protein